MFKSHLKVKPSKIGYGLFTDVKIPANSPILEMTADVTTWERLPNQDHPAVIQVGANIFMSPSGDIDDHINHSCNPNCRLQIVGKRVHLYSLYVIPAGAELTYDYSTTSTDSLEEWKMDCLCGHFNCRKLISGFQYLDNKTQEDYRKKGVLPIFMVHQIFMRK